VIAVPIVNRRRVQIVELTVPIGASNMPTSEVELLGFDPEPPAWIWSRVQRDR
jgi:hypothetical protein